MTIDEERSVLARLVAHLDQCVDQWRDATVGPGGQVQVVPGSALAADMVAGFDVGTIAWHAVIAAVDHLVCFRDSLIISRSATTIDTMTRTHSQYTLLRAALENASLAVWLLAPDDHLTRVIRRARVKATSIDNLERLSRNVGLPLDRSKAEKITAMRNALTTAGLTADEVNQAVKVVGNGTIVKETAPVAGLDPKIALAMWNMGSGVAHADFDAAQLFLQFTPPDPASPAPGFTEIKGSEQNLHMGALAAIAAIRTALDLFGTRASA